jgi:hypothetical protein
VVYAGLSAIAIESGRTDIRQIAEPFGEIFCRIEAFCKENSLEANCAGIK